MADRRDLPRHADATPETGCPVPHGAETSCPVTGATSGAHPPLAWTAAALDAVMTSRDRASGSHLDEDRAENMAANVVEARAERAGVDTITDLFVQTLGRKLGYGHPLSERTDEQTVFTWLPEAEARLAEVPDFCRELTRWRVEWTARKLGLGTTIGLHEMDVKFELWGAVSHTIQERDRDALHWTDSARARFDRIPEFVRGQVLEAVEGNARTLGLTEVNDAVVDLVIAHWSETGDFHEGLYGYK